MGRLWRFTFYTKIQLSLLIFILLPLAFVSTVSYIVIKNVVVGKVQSSRQNVVDVIAGDLNKNAEDIIYASNLFGNNASSTFGDLKAFKDVSRLSSSKEYALYMELSELLDLAFSKTTGLNSQVFFINNSHMAIYGTSSELSNDYLQKWLARNLDPEWLRQLNPNRINWISVSDLELSTSTANKESYEFAVRKIVDFGSGEVLGTLFVGIPHEYFKQLFAGVGSGQLQLFNEQEQLIYGYPNAGTPANDASQMEVRSDVSKTGWHLVYRSASAEVTGEISRIFHLYSVLLAVCILAFFIISVWIARSLHRPLNKLRRTAEQFGRGNRHIRFPAKGKDEVAVLGSAFNHMLDQIDQLFGEIEQEQEEKRIIELQALFSQIRPHFLLNTLNSIKCNLVLSGDEIHSRQIDSLMSMLRAYMRVNELSTLEQECKLLRDYTDIMKMRNEMRLELIIDLPEEERMFKVPRLILQPLVENAIVHGFVDPPVDPQIRIAIRNTGDHMRIEVADNGTGMPERELAELQASFDEAAEPGASNRRIGLNNVYRRLKLTYGHEVAIRITARQGYGTAVVMAIPSGALLEQEEGALHVQSHDR
jgi:sensor histidine kinase YesM